MRFLSAFFDVWQNSFGQGRTSSVWLNCKQCRCWLQHVMHVASARLYLKQPKPKCAPIKVAAASALSITVSASRSPCDSQELELVSS